MDDWEKLYARSSQDECDEITALLAIRLTKQKRHQRLVVVYGLPRRDRRKEPVRVHWVGGDRRQPRRPRPIDYLFPILATQVIMFLLSFAVPRGQAIVQMAVGNFVVAGIAMLPAAWNNKRRIA
jgi:hypothetical protein